MKDRIRQIMEAQHMSQQAFADFIGTTAGTLSGIFNERTRPTLNIVEAIKKKIPNINTDWLMFGTGSMFVDATQTPPQTAEPATADRRATPPQETMIDFGAFAPQAAAPTPQVVPAAGRYATPPRSTHQEVMRTEVKIQDRPQRKVTEIRVYYDDQTWESFTPAKR